MYGFGFEKMRPPYCEPGSRPMRPGCGRDGAFARGGAFPGGKGPGRPPLPPFAQGQCRHGGPASTEPGGPPPFHGKGPGGLGGPFGHGPGGPGGPCGHGGPGGHGHGPGGPGGRGARPPRGKLTESPRYRQDDTNGKLLALLRVLGHKGHAMEGRGGQNRVLTILKEEGEMTQRALTERLGIQPGSASEIIGKLEKAGYLIRTPGLEDRRTADVSLTEAGAARAEEAAAKYQAQREEMLAALSGEERETLLALLEKLYNAWAEQHP